MFVLLLECVITHEICHGVLPLLELSVVSLISLTSSCFQAICKNFQDQSQKKKLALREFLDVKILELETLAYKDSEDEYFTLIVELPGLHGFIKELKQIANSMHTGFANLSLTYSAKLCSIEKAMAFHQVYISNQGACDCLKSNYHKKSTNVGGNIW